MIAQGGAGRGPREAPMLRFVGWRRPRFALLLGELGSGTLVGCSKYPESVLTDDTFLPRASARAPFGWLLDTAIPETL